MASEKKHTPSASDAEAPVFDEPSRPVDDGPTAQLKVAARAFRDASFDTEAKHVHQLKRILHALTLLAEKPDPAKLRSFDKLAKPLIAWQQPRNNAAGRLAEHFQGIDVHNLSDDVIESAIAFALASEELRVRVETNWKHVTLKQRNDARAAIRKAVDNGKKDPELLAVKLLEGLGASREAVKDLFNFRAMRAKRRTNAV